MPALSKKGNSRHGRIASLARQVPVAAQEERQTGEQEARWPRIAGHHTRTTFLSLRPLHHRATAIVMQMTPPVVSYVKPPNWPPLGQK